MKINSRHFRSELVKTDLANRINYAQCWEDEDILLEALDVGPGDKVLSICSGGDNSIALALAGADVTAVDLSEPQIAVAELKLAGRFLHHAEFLQLMGLGQPGRRVHIYHQIKGELSEPSRRFWDANEGTIRLGLLGLGRFERYLDTFRTKLLPLVHRRKTIEAFLGCASIDEQQAFYADRWDNLRWRSLFRLFFSEVVMARLGRSPEQFAHVDGPVAEAFLGRAKHAFCDLDCRTNPYLQWMLVGTFLDLDHSRAYLTADGHSRLGDAAERLTLVHGDLEGQLAQPGWTAFNFSNLFEYVTPDHHEGMLRAAIAGSGSGARLAYWNTLVPRSRPASLADQLDVTDTSDLLFRDRAFVYGGFNLERVR
ncbi:MAG: DUF3419 family protein [Proteobacteria bacterium]|nr:DUF3419 family protein [Pseudomonadota bacterium]